MFSEPAATVYPRVEAREKINTWLLLFENTLFAVAFVCPGHEATLFPPGVTKDRQKRCVFSVAEHLRSEKKNGDKDTYIPYQGHDTKRSRCHELAAEVRATVVNKRL